MSKSWYLALYDDVANANLDIKTHYLNYGKQELRFLNFSTFINANKPNFILKYLYKILWFFFKTRYLKYLKFKNSFLTNIFIALFNYEIYNKLNKLKFNDIFLRPWFYDGVETATNLILQKISRNKIILDFRGFENMEGYKKFPMKLNIWENGVILISYNIIFPTELLYKLTLKRKVNLHVHHAKGFEGLLDTLINKLNSTTKIYTFLHDYYFFTDQMHLFTNKAITLKEAMHLTNFDSYWPLNSRLKLLQKSNKLIVPSHRMKQLINEVHPKLNVEVFYFPENASLEDLKVRNPNFKNKIAKILLLGNIGINKGSKIIQDLLNFDQTTIKNFTMFEIYHFGKYRIDTQNPSYFFLGEYTFGKTPMTNFVLALLPFQCEETYSFTLSEILKLKLPLISTIMGAIPERVFSRQSTRLLTPNAKIEEWVNAILNLNEESNNFDIQSHLGLDKEGLNKILNSRLRLTNYYE